MPTASCRGGRIFAIRLCGCYLKRYKGHPSMTVLDPQANKIGDQGVNALANLKATQMIRFQNTRARYTFGHEECSSEVLNAFDFVAK